MKQKSPRQIALEKESEEIIEQVDREYEESPPLVKFRPAVTLAIWPGRSLYCVWSDRDHRYPGGARRVLVKAGVKGKGAAYERIASMAERTRAGVAQLLDETGAETVLMPYPEPWQRKRPEQTEFQMGQVWTIGGLCEERDIGFVPVVMPTVRQELTGFAIAPRPLMAHVAQEMGRKKLPGNTLAKSMNYMDATVLLGWYEGWPTDYDLEHQEKAQEYRRRRSLSRLEGGAGRGPRPGRRGKASSYGGSGAGGEGAA